MKKQEKVKYFKNKLEQEIEEALYLDELCYGDYETIVDKTLLNYTDINSTLSKEELQK